MRVLSMIMVGILLINFSFVPSAYAYLDPNAGGFFLQVVIPMFFAVAATITVFWRRVVGQIKGVLNKLKGQDDSSKEG